MIFSEADSTPTLDEISQELVRRLPHELREAKASNKLWTKAVKSVLYGIGVKPGVLVCCHGSKENGEWLLDLIWMGLQQHQIILAVESEWGGPGDVEDDFEKLMSIKAPRKLMLFNAYIHESDAVVRRLESLLKAYPYHIEGEEYLVLNVAAERALRYRFRVPKTETGRLDGATLSVIAPLEWPWNHTEE